MKAYNLIFSELKPSVTTLIELGNWISIQVGCELKCHVAKKTTRLIRTNGYMSQSDITTWARRKRVNWQWKQLHALFIIAGGWKFYGVGDVEIIIKVEASKSLTRQLTRMYKNTTKTTLTSDCNKYRYTYLPTTPYWAIKGRGAMAGLPLFLLTSTCRLQISNPPLIIAFWILIDVVFPLAFNCNHIKK